MMRTKPKVDVYVPHGFYCGKCYRTEMHGDRFYCQVYGGQLDRTPDGRLLKSESCLLACRKALQEGTV